MKGLILASGSPRRAEILAEMGLSFEIAVPDTDETVPDGCPADRAVELLARRKALAVHTLAPDKTVIGADTVVVLDGEILGKPADADDARRMLTALSGRTHTVYTGVCIANEHGVDCFVCDTQVEFYPLDPDIIDSYISSGEPFDKAGGYGIQGLGRILVKSIKGDFFTVMGLPAAEVYRRLSADK